MVRASTLVGRSNATSRNAAIGGMRAAFHAGRIAERIVTTPPTDEADDDRARLDDDPAARDVDADQREQALEQSRHEDAAEDAEAGREEPDHKRLAQHGQQHLPAARADRAQQRELTRPLGDDDRERVVDDEDRDDERDEREDREAELEETELLPDRDPDSPW